MPEAAGSIYDLGYQRYTGVRLGRRHAVWSLYTYSLRVVFGIGRSFWAKAGAFGILGIALIPAVVQLGVAALSPEEIEVIRPDEYYGIIAPLLAVFCAIVAPDLGGRDQRTRTLSLYFSRALRRSDYAVAKFAALVTAMLTITVVPQALMFVGNMSSETDAFDYLGDHWTDIPAIFGSALMLSAVLGGIGLAIAAQMPRRSYATVAIVAAFVLSSAIAAAVFEAANDPETGRWVLLLSPLHVVQGTTFWFFGVSAAEQGEEQLVEADFAGIVYAIDAVVVALLMFGLALRRYRRVEA